MSSSENINAVYDMILADRRIGLKHKAETLEISYERVHHIIYVDLDTKFFFGKMDSQMLECRSKVSTGGSIALNLYPF
jgi:hypothetical protein